MDNKDIIEGLKLTKDLCEFDPVTGGKIDRHGMNKMYDAICGALERLTPKKVGGSKCPGCNANVEYKSRFCPDCGQALDWRL